MKTLMKHQHAGLTVPTDQLPKAQMVQPLSDEQLDVFDQEVWVFLLQEAEARQLLLAAGNTSDTFILDAQVVTMALA